MDLVAMSARELNRAEVLQRVLDKRLTRMKASELLGISERQTCRLCKAMAAGGPSALVSKKRGRPSNRRLPEALRNQVVAFVVGGARSDPSRRRCDREVMENLRV